MEMNQSNSVTEWTTPGGQTGLQEPLWQLGFGGGTELYPERPDEADCIYYLRTGFCGYGSRCRFNHPRDRGGSVVGAMSTVGGDYPERLGQPVCQYYMRTGMCKFGASCKYHHPREGDRSASAVALNISGYPLRPGEKECSYYVKTGQCKFGVTCKFHHPQPAGVQVVAPAAGPLSSQQYGVVPPQQYGVVPGNWPVARPTLLPGSYLPGTYGPVLIPPGMVPIQSWNPYQAPVNPAASPHTQPSAGVGSLYGITQLSLSGPSYTGAYLSRPSSGGPSSSSQNERTFPERPGQPECQYYIKTGDCKFGSSCRYHHPSEWSATNTNIVLSPMGLPLRPGAPLCTHYAQNGVCNYGPTCKFDHPMRTLSYNTSASSIADMHVAPYPVGTSIATLAPSSSSSDFRPQLISASNKDTLFSIMPSGNMSSGSVGSSFSKSTPPSQSTGSTSTSHGQPEQKN